MQSGAQVNTTALGCSRNVDRHIPKVFANMRSAVSAASPASLSMMVFCAGVPGAPITRAPVATTGPPDRIVVPDPLTSSFETPSEAAPKLRPVLVVTAAIGAAASPFLRAAETCTVARLSLVAANPAVIFKQSSVATVQPLTSIWTRPGCVARKHAESPQAFRNRTRNAG